MLDVYILPNNLNPPKVALVILGGPRGGVDQGRGGSLRASTIP
jgi:hypothetical protein